MAIAVSICEYDTVYDYDSISTDININKNTSTSISIRMIITVMDFNALVIISRHNYNGLGVTL